MRSVKIISSKSSHTRMRAVVCILVLLLVCSAIADQSCGENASFRRCGSHCPPSCGDTRPQACIASCKSGCFCDDGYLRNSQGKCVRKEDC